MTELGWFIAAVGIILFCLAGVPGYKIRKMHSVVDSMEKTRSMTVAEAASLATETGSIVEVYGIALADLPLIAPASRRRCIYFREIIEEYKRYRSLNHLRAGRWVTIVDQVRITPFEVKDWSGTITVLGTGAEVFAGQSVKNHTQRARLPEAVSAAFLGFLTEDGTQRASEWIIPVGQPVYVHGPCVETPLGPRIDAVGEEKFIISDRPERSLKTVMKMRSVIYIGAASLLATVGVTVSAYALSGMPTTNPNVIWHHGYPFLLVGLAAFACLFFATAKGLFKWERDDRKKFGDKAFNYLTAEITGAPVSGTAEAWDALENVKVSRCPRCAAAMADGTLSCLSCGWVAPEGDTGTAEPGNVRSKHGSRSDEPGDGAGGGRGSRTAEPNGETGGGRDS